VLSNAVEDSTRARLAGLFICLRNCRRLAHAAASWRFCGRTNTRIRLGDTSSQCVPQSGEVLGQTVPRHTSAAFVEFLGNIVSNQPKGRAIHVIADNLSIHKAQAVRTFLIELPPLAPPLGQEDPKESVRPTRSNRSRNCGSAARVTGRILIATVRSRRVSRAR
jgi:hypothetical protein